MKILLAVDLAQHPEPLVDELAEWADRLGATVDLVHVDEERIPAVRVGDPDTQAALDWAAEHVEDERLAALRALMERLPAAARGQVHWVVGPIADQIVGLAGQYDLLAVGTHGRTGLSHLWLGSVAEKVVRASPKPVLTLRSPPAR